MKKYLLILIILVSVQNSDAIELQITESQVLGVDETINVVKDSLINRIKIRALDQSGTFTLSEKTYNSVNDQIEEKIKLKSLARVFIKQHQHSLSIKDGQVIVTVQAKVQFDDGRERSRADLDSIAEKDATIAGLRFQNRILQSRSVSSAATMRSSDTPLASSLNTNYSSEEFSAVSLLPGELFNLESASSSAHRSAVVNFKARYANIWSSYSNELYPVVRSVYRDGDFTYISVDITVPAGILSEVLKPTVFSSVTGKNWARVSDLVDVQPDRATQILESAKIIGNSPVSLVIEVGQSEVKIPFFGIGQESFLGDQFRPFEKTSGKVKIVDLMREHKRTAIGFYTPLKRDSNYRVDDGHATIKIRINESDVLSASDIKARLVAIDAPN